MTTHETTDTQVLSTNQCWELLRESVVGRLAVTVDGSPDIFPVNPVVDHGTIVFRTTAGTKLAATKGRDVAFEVDGYDAGTAQAWSVVVKGRAFQILEIEETLRALRLPLYPWQPGRKPRFVRIEPTTVTGRRFVVDGGFTSPPPDQHTPNQHTPNQHRDLPTTT
jgi:nitroimidazol reductase NimA-like FMN-containing flavoprotein (pyridoxamine 5'-phosphate oxidase superfamily)